MSKLDISKVVLQLLNDGNKPFSFNEIVEKCDKDFGKAGIQKALDTLLFREMIVEKSFGKQKLYFVRQADYNPKEVKAELQLLTQKKAALEATLKSKLEKVRDLEAKLKSFAAIPSLGTLEEEKKDLQDHIDAMSIKLDSIHAKKGKKVSVEDVKNVEKRNASYLSVYRKRKRICNDMVEAILEGYPKSKKELIEDIGMETDEAVGYSVPK